VFVTFFKNVLLINPKQTKIKGVIQNIAMQWKDQPRIFLSKTILSEMIQIVEEKSYFEIK